MFSFISQNWRGKPLTSLAVIVSLIAATWDSEPGIGSENVGVSNSNRSRVCPTNNMTRL